MEGNQATGKNLIAVLAVAAALIAPLAIANQAFAASRPYERGEAAAAQSDWTPDLDCAQCHVDQAASLGMAEGGATATEDADDEATLQSEAEEPSTAEEPDKQGDAEAAVERPESEGENEAAAEGEATAGVSTASAAEAAEADPIGSYAQMHVETLGFTCVTCHEESDDIKAAHLRMKSADVPTKLTKTEIPNDMCLSCHDQEELAETTADCTVLTDSNGTVVNPHELPDVGDHADVKCVDCHQAHDTSKTLEEASITTCSSCHHAGVYECNTCH